MPIRKINMAKVRRKTKKIKMARFRNRTHLKKKK